MATPPTASAEPTPAGDSFIERNLRMMEHLAHVRHVVVVMSGKGGVGKSTVAVNVAAVMARQARTVGLLDLDITNPNDPRMMGLQDFQFEGLPPFKPPEAHGVRMASTSFFIRHDQAVIWRGPIKVKMIRELIGGVEWGPLDALVVDLPPGTSDEPLSVAQMIPKKTGALLVTTPQTVSTDDVRRSIAFARRVNMPVLGIVENMSGFTCPSCGTTHDIFGAGGGESLAKEAGVPFLGRIPIDPAVVGSGDSGRPIVVGSPKSATAKAFVALEEAVRDKLAAFG